MEVLRLGCRRAGGFLSRDEKTPQTPGQRTAPTKATSLWALARSKAQLAWGTLGKLHFAIIKLGSWNSWDFGTVKQRFRKAFYFYFISSCLTDFWKELISQTEMVLGEWALRACETKSVSKGLPLHRHTWPRCFMWEMQRKLRWGLWLSPGPMQTLCVQWFQNTRSGAWPPGFESQHCSWVAVWPWASYLTCQCLAVFSYTMRTIVPTELDLS